MGHIDPTKEIFAIFRESDRPGPIHMLNLVRLRKDAAYPDGRKAELWMNPDGSYISEGRRHDRHRGHWQLKGDKVCFRRMMFTYCTPIPSGTAFTTKAVTGETIRVRLAPGRQGEHAG